MKSFKMIVIYLCCMAYASCTKLIREDYQNIPANQFFKTEEDASASLTAYYANAMMRLNNIGYENIGMMSETQTDIMEFAYNGNVGYFTNHFFLSASQYSTNLGDIIASYSTIVKNISTGTNLIAALENLPLSAMSADTKKNYIAQVRVLRAFSALWGYNMYGGVELFLDPKILADVDHAHFQPRATQKEMADFIISEIEAVKDDLPGRYEGSDPDYGRVTKGAALTIELKVLMQEKRWAEAITTAREIMTIGYQLVPVYSDIFTLANKGNSETILSIPCKTNVYGNSFLQEMIPYDYPTARPINKYGTWQIRWSFYDTFDSLDERRKQIVAQYTNTSGVLVTRGTGQLTNGAFVLKYQIDPGMTGGASGVDWIVYRYADVLLLLAEAINNANGPTQEAIDLVNQIRARAFPNRPDKLLQLANFGGNQAAFNKAILAERGWELFMEYTRRMDLIRNNMFIANALTVEPRGPIGDFILLWPIPPDIVAQSKGIVTQNPGY